MTKVFTLISFLVIFSSCQSKGNSDQKKSEHTQPNHNYSKLDTATFAGGCFWCIEASFEQIKGVVEAVSGYSGGTKANAHYKLVSYGKTKHAETVQIYYDPSRIDYATLLDIFFTAHDPTQLNRQGPDVGTQYRSVIFYHNENQLKLAKAKIAEIQPQFDSKIVTELTPFKAFYEAEDYHQNYEKNHPYDPYIIKVSRPKIDRVKKKFADQLKEE